MERALSSDEDDGESLIAQNERKNRQPRRLMHSFEISNSSDRRRFEFRSTGFCIFLLSICFLLVSIYFFIDARRYFVDKSAPAEPDSHAVDVRMRDNELLALNLLRNQQIGLLRLWNQTTEVFAHRSSDSFAPISASNASSNSTLVDPSFDELQSTLLEQIKINVQIQKTLLSSRGFPPGNISDGLTNPLSGYVSVDMCRKAEEPERKRTIKWNPRQNKFLLAICVSGQISNHLICLQKHMFFAALLDRVLIIPSPKFDYQYDKVIDIDHINQCFGRKVVITFEEFSKKNKMQIDRFICYMTTPPCFVDEEHAKRLKSLGLSLPKLQAAWPEDPKSEKKRGIGDIRSKFSCNDDVLAVGDIFYANVEEDSVMQPGGPLEHHCKTLIQPSKIIHLTAQRFVQTFLGSNFIALHFRRHGFLQFCNAKEESCFFPVPQAAECILRVAAKSNAPVIYLSTDAASSETDVLQSLLALDGRSIPLIKRPAHNSVEKWDALLYRNHLGEDNQIEAMLDKTICAMASVFIGSSGSTFTDDIFRLRKDWGVASVCDENLCQGERPNFIASRG